jgi:hypothetical protein
MTTVSSLPTVPSRGNAATFNTLFEAFLSALKNDFVPEVNTVAGEINSAAASAGAAVATALVGTSSTSVTVGTGSKTFTVASPASKLFQSGQYVTASSVGTPGSYMHGIVVSYSTSTGALVITSSTTSGSGTYTDWAISISGPRGADGEVTLTGTQTLTNKTLTSPTITSPSISSPTLTGTPVAPTATGGTNTTQVATTAFVTSAVAAVNPMTYPGAGVAVSNGSSWGSSKSAPSGNLVGDTDAQTLENKTLVAPVLGTPASGNLSSCTADGTNPVGYKNIPQNSQSTNYTAVLADAGKHLYRPTSDTTARTWTIPSNASVAFPIGTAITFINDGGNTTNVNISINTDTLVFSDDGTTGTRTLGRYGIATAIKVTSTRWYISGTKLT